MLMIRQLFNIKYYSFTYIIFSNKTNSGVIIDPIREDVDKYLQLISELNIKLYYIFETHLHADHITGAALLSQKHKNCPIVMGYETTAKNVDFFISDNQEINSYDITIKAIHTPGHTSDSYCYLIESYLFTGDTLLIRKTGRSDLHSGSARDQYQSIKNKLFILPGSTIIYPGHDYPIYFMI
jgi:sulfur dioxygenase